MAAFARFGDLDQRRTPGEVPQGCAEAVLESCGGRARG